MVNYFKLNEHVKATEMCIQTQRILSDISIVFNGLQIRIYVG